MKKYNHIICLAAATVLFAACDDKELPSDPVLTMPVSSLVLEVSGECYVAVPTLTDGHSFTGELDLAVKVPSAKAVVTEIALLKGYSTDIAPGDVVNFEDNRLALPIYKDGTAVSGFSVVMKFNPPPFFYFVKTSDKDENGDGYFLTPATQARIASATYDNFFEGEVDLTGSNWDNVALVNEDMSTIYNKAEGPWPALSAYSWTAETKNATTAPYFKSEGPWNDWLVTNGNQAVVSPGVWRVNFDSSTNRVDMTMTQWAVFGTAVDKLTALTYDSATRSWGADIFLSAGAVHFETIPVTFGDARFRLGYKADILGQLASDGSDIAIEQPGEYSVTLTLSNPPYYTYTISKK